MKYNLGHGRYVPYYPDQTPEWDNDNHIMEEERRRRQEAWEAARFDFGSLTELSDEEIPF